MSKVNVLDEEGNVVARVEYNSNLDHWDGSNWTAGSMGIHKGITKLKDGRYVLIHGSDWQGDQSYGEIISKEQAIQEIVKGNVLLIKEKKFADLNELYEKFETLEMTDE